MAGTALPLLLAANLSALPDPPPVHVPIAEPILAAGSEAEAAQPFAARGGAPRESRWFARLGALGAFYHSGARIQIAGRPSPGATVTVSDNATMIFDIGFDVSRDVSVLLMGGVPPRPTVSAAGSIASLGTLGEVRYGPVILTGLYHLPRVGRLRPYAGTGLGYAIIVDSHDGAVSHLRVHNDWGFVLQAGFEFPLTRKWGLFADVKRVWLSVDADGSIGPNALAARVRLDPTLVSIGTTYRFR
jgi:outer membrane protein